jgi:hypothetical protein
MATEKQDAANRLNAQKSTGTRTPDHPPKIGSSIAIVKLEQSPTEAISPPPGGPDDL